MKRILFTLLVMLPLMASAQKFGYFSYDAVLKSMPQYKEAMVQVDALKARYEEEMKRSEEDFNRKYNEFLDGQKNFTQNIMLKRQKELQDLYENGIAFRAECKKMLEEGEEKLILPVKSKLNTIIGEVGMEYQLEYILNADGNSLLFAGPNGINLNEIIISRLNR